MQSYNQRNKAFPSLCIAGLNINDQEKSPGDIRMGQLLPNSNISFEKSESSQLTLVGKSKGLAAVVYPIIVAFHLMQFILFIYSLLVWMDSMECVVEVSFDL